MKNLNVKLLILVSLFLAANTQAGIPEATGNKFECVQSKTVEPVIAIIELDPLTTQAIVEHESFGGFGSYKFSNIGKCPTRLCGSADLLVKVLPHTKAPSETVINLHVVSGQAFGSISFSQHGSTRITHVYCQQVAN